MSRFITPNLPGGLPARPIRRHTFRRESADLKNLMRAGRHFDKQEIQPCIVGKTDGRSATIDLPDTRCLSGTPLAYSPFVPTLGVQQ
jgi:hypothetical protein